MTMTRYTMLDAMLGRRRLTVKENQRVIALHKGRFMDILGPGEHLFSGYDGHLMTDMELETHDLTRPELVTSLEAALFRERTDLVEAHLIEVRTGPDEVGVVLRDGRIYAILKPDGRSVFWKDAGPWEVERIDVSADLALPAGLQRRFERFGATDRITRFNVEQEQVGLLFVDGAFLRMLAPGAHMFWNVGRRVMVKLIETRRQSLDVTGQEILTKDRVSIRVNLAAEYRVVDPVKAATMVKDFADALYREVQYAFRKSLGAKTLDEILEQKISVDAEAAERVRTAMKEIGLEVGEIALKDVVLPGEMREILNTVVLAEKEAQANVIRRREETAATRSLLNTAKVMEENPIMLRLKELEALETIAEKVDSLVVHNGPKGLMTEIAKLSD
ncbi:MAG: slipin family protein [Rhodobacteraceae bacterium]|nr:slipin family protein [Paracoccaceae bacterium]